MPVPKCIYPKSIFAKCTRLACLLNLVSLFCLVIKVKIVISCDVWSVAMFCILSRNVGHIWSILDITFDVAKNFPEKKAGWGCQGSFGKSPKNGGALPFLSPGHLKQL